MHCKEWEERVALHAGGDLAAEMVSAVERHLAGCSRCEALWSGMRESLELLQAAHEEPLPPAAYTAVRARVMAELSRRLILWWRWAGLAAAAAAVLVVLAVWPLPKVQPLPPVALAVPPAPPLPIPKPRPHPAAPHRQPLLVRLVTNDPNVVIYWIAE